MASRVCVNEDCASWVCVNEDWTLGVSMDIGSWKLNDFGCIEYWALKSKWFGVNEYWALKSKWLWCQWILGFEN